MTDDAVPWRTVAAVLLAAAVSSCAREPRATALSAEEVALENRGVGLMGQYDFDGARAVFVRLAAAHPERTDLRVDLALASLNRQQSGDEDEARRTLEAVLALDPRSARAHYSLALILLHEGRARDALPHFVAAAEQDPRDAHAAYFAAQCRAELGDLEGARRSYEQALTLNPRLRSAAYGAFQTLQRLGRTTDAERMLRVFQALEKNPQSEVAEFKYTRMGRLAEAWVNDEPPRRRLPRPDGPVFDRTPLPLAPTPRAIVWRRFDAHAPASITAVDIDGDGRTDLFIARALEDRGVIRNAVLLNRPDGFSIDLDHPLAAVTDVNAALWGDYDNDGLIDVYFCRDRENQLWRQVAPGRWSNVTAPARAAGRGRTVDGAMFDADHDGDLDLLLVGADGANELLNNNGDGTFRSLGAAAGLSTRPATGLVLADLDADRDADIIIVGASPPHQVLVNDRMWQYRSDAKFDRLASAAIGAAVAADVDADGVPEVYTSSAAGLERWTGADSGAWEARRIGGTEALANARRLAVADIDGDGRLDIVAGAVDGRWQALAVSDAGDATMIFADADTPVAGWTLAVLDAARGPSLVAMPAAENGPPILWGPGRGRFPFVSVAPSGRRATAGSVRSNRSGVGTAMAARVDSRWTAISNLRSQSGAGQSLQPLAIGTGGEPQVDFVAITWSDGVLQTELALQPGSIHTVEETERQLSSCPVLFAFDGRHFAFVTDILGVGGLGTPSRPGVYDPPRPVERVLLPDGLLQPRATGSEPGRFELKLAEPMEEVAYLDSVRLVAYDLPPGWQMVLDERKATALPEATGEPRFFRDERVPVEAIDDGGRDVTAALQAADGIDAPPGRLDARFIGLTDEHSLILRFDRPLDDGPGDPLLVADGWIEYPYAQTLFAAWQAGVTYRAPTVDARGADGRWHVLRRQFGYPAGMPRRMSVPLGRLPQGTRELRLRTNQQIYWDRLAVAYGAACPLAVRHPLPLTSATMARSGFAMRASGTGRHPAYDDDRHVPIWDARAAAGSYTAEGAITELLAAADGALAIIGPGEEIRLEFAQPQAAVRSGWTRRYVLEARGWCKDMDLYTRDGDTVEPVPVHPRTAAAAALQRQFTTRYASGR